MLTPIIPGNPFVEELRESFTGSVLMTFVFVAFTNFHGTDDAKNSLSITLQFINKLSKESLQRVHLLCSSFDRNVGYCFSCVLILILVIVKLILP